jgi:hypothetical protein
MEYMSDAMTTDPRPAYILLLWNGEEWDIVLQTSDRHDAMDAYSTVSMRANGEVNPDARLLETNASI